MEIAITLPEPDVRTEREHDPLRGTLVVTTEARVRVGGRTEWRKATRLTYTRHAETTKRLQGLFGHHVLEGAFVLSHRGGWTEGRDYAERDVREADLAVYGPAGLFPHLDMYLLFKGNPELETKGNWVFMGSEGRATMLPAEVSRKW